MTGPRSAHPEFVSQPTCPWTFGEQDKSNSDYQSFKSNNFFDAKNLARHALLLPCNTNPSSEQKALQIKTPLKITNSQSFAEFICKCDNISVLLDCLPLKAGKVLQNRKTLTTLPAEYKVIEKYYWQMFWKRRVTLLSDLKSNKPYSFTNLYLNLTASLQSQFKSYCAKEWDSKPWVTEEPDRWHCSPTEHGAPPAAALVHPLVAPLHEPLSENAAVVDDAEPAYLEIEKVV